MLNKLGDLRLEVTLRKYICTVGLHGLHGTDTYLFLALGKVLRTLVHFQIRHRHTFTFWLTGAGAYDLYSDNA